MRRRQRSATRLLAVWLAMALAVLLAPFSLHLVVVDGFRLPLLLIAAPLLAFLLWQKLWRRSTIVALVTLALLAPWLSSGSTPIPQDMQQIKLIVLPSSDPEALEYAVAEKPDLIFIPDFSDETDRALGKQKAILPDPNQRPEVGAALPELTGDYRPWILKTSDGMAIFMRAGLGDADDLRVREARVGSNALVVDAKLAGIDLTLATVHFTRPFPINQFGRQVLEVERLSAQLGAIPRPIILAGDFNALPWSGVLDELSEAVGATGAQWIGTFPAWSPVKLPIDQVRVSGGVQIVSLETGPFVGSIHLPLVAVIALPPR